MRLTSKVNFSEEARRSLNMLLGEDAASAIIYHIGGVETLENPEAFEKKLKALLGAGAEIILKHILENMRTTSEAITEENSQTLTLHNTRIKENKEH